MALKDDFKSEAGVYSLRCRVNGKYYVGETKNVKARMKSHSYNNKTVIGRAIRKHGFENFEVSVFYLPEKEKDLLLSVEEFLIKKLNSLVPNGYNVCPVGKDNSGRIVSEETKARMSAAATGRKFPPEVRRKMAAAKIGKTHSPETRQRMSNARKIYWKNKKAA